MAGKFKVTQSLLDKYYFEKYILEVAIATLENGGSVSKIATRQFLPSMDVWRFPKYPGKTSILPASADLLISIRFFINTNRVLLEESDCCLGTWIHPQSKEYYLDVSTSREDLSEAIQAAHKASKRDGRSIVALYNAVRKETVYL